MDVGVGGATNQMGAVPVGATQHDRNLPLLQSDCGQNKSGVSSRGTGSAYTSGKNGTSKHPETTGEDAEVYKELRMIAKLEGIVERLLDRRLGGPMPLHNDPRAKTRLRETENQQKARSSVKDTRKEGKEKTANRVATIKKPTTLNSPANADRNRMVNKAKLATKPAERNKNKSVNVTNKAGSKTVTDTQPTAPRAPQDSWVQVVCKKRGQKMIATSNRLLRKMEGIWRLTRTRSTTTSNKTLARTYPSQPKRPGGNPERRPSPSRALQARMMK